MFKLKRVELLGFKSFADRTRLEFGEGTVAVVGPNGCGKSNLSDAISWVLGEQSARLLRGDRMSDVIFNGTGLRPPTGLAEVSLTLIDPEALEAEAVLPAVQPKVEPADEITVSLAAEAGEASAPDEAPPSAAVPQNGNGAPPAPSRTLLRHRGGEIVVTRRLFRSGESEYLINGDTCRLRDIQDLFTGTGLGPASYAIIEQGRIGQILSSKPSDRRAILEEAAGVAKFRTRKRLAETKLESSRLNLGRVTDILEEVTKQVNSLKRQASKARRYRELKEELRARQKRAVVSRWIALECECERLREELWGLESEFAGVTEELATLEREQKTVARRHEELEAELARLRDQLAQSELEQERLRSRGEQARQQGAGFESRLAEAERERVQLSTQLAALDEQRTLAARRSEQVRCEAEEARATLARLQAGQRRLGSEVASAEARVEECRSGLLAVVERAAELRNQLVKTEEIGLGFERQAARAQAEQLRAEQERAEFKASLEATLADHERETGASATLESAAFECAGRLEAAKREQTERRGDVERLHREWSEAQARRQALEESLARHAYSTESVRRLLAGAVAGNGNGFHPLGLLADFVEVEPGYEELVEDFFKRELDCVVVERHDEARQGIALLERQGSGRSTFFVKQFHSNGHGNGHGAPKESRPAGVVAALAEVVRVDARLGLNGEGLLPALEGAYVVRDAATAERLAQEYPRDHFLTPQGDHYHHRLVSGGKTSGGGPLALRRDFRELDRRTTELEQARRSAEQQLSEASGLAARLDDELRGLNAAKVEAEKKSVVADEKMRQARELVARAEERLGVMGNERAAAEREQHEVEARRAALVAQLNETEADEMRRSGEISLVTQSSRDARQRLDRLAEELVEGQARSSALDERAAAAQAEGARLNSSIEEAGERSRRLDEQCETWSAERRRMLDEAAKAAEELLRLEAGRKESAARRETLEHESVAARERRDRITPDVDAARAALEAIRERRTGAEVALARAESDRDHHGAQCREDLGAEPQALQADIAPGEALEGEALQAAEQEVREIKARLENLGPVNQMALEELQESEERFTFLETQRQDLLGAIEDITQAIREIDQVSRRQFLDAFTAINGYFAESFRTLFGGGTGQMRLSDEADPESGVDIVAQPPGKRLQNVLLLSGGEKALAALALLIAVFRYAPSPFCILDEVDSPLDDSNVGRFTRLVDAMSAHTQFILITHNKRTMEVSRVMYGVTMEEPGVSKLVSVRFAERERVAVPA